MKAIFAAQMFPPMRGTNEFVIGSLTNTQSSLLATSIILVLMLGLVAGLVFTRKMNE